MSGPPNAKYEPAIGHLTWRALTPADAKKWPTAGILSELDPWAARAPLNHRRGPDPRAGPQRSPSPA